MAAGRQVRCVACHLVIRGRESNIRVCIDCEESVRVDLQSLPNLYVSLLNMGDEALMKSQGIRSEISVHRTEAPLPFNGAAFDLMQATDGVVPTLQGWVHSWYDDLEWTHPTWTGSDVAQIDIAVKILAVNLPWAVEHRPDFTRFKGDVVRIVRGCIRVVSPGDPAGRSTPRLYLGKCPTRVDDVPCGVTLTVKAGSNVIKCSKCGTVWPMILWPSLRDAM